MSVQNQWVKNGGRTLSWTLSCLPVALMLKKMKKELKIWILLRALIGHCEPPRVVKDRSRTQMDWCCMSTDSVNSNAVYDVSIAVTQFIIVCLSRLIEVFWCFCGAFFFG